MFKYILQDLTTTETQHLKKVSDDTKAQRWRVALMMLFYSLSVFLIYLKAYLYYFSLGYNEDYEKEEDRS
jgi:hypothetical protein